MLVHGYKGMEHDMTCRGMQFEIGKTNHVDGKIELCKNGIHFCQKLADVFNYYNKDDNHRFFEVETSAPVISDKKKSVTSELTILRELTDVEVNRAFYSRNGYGDGDGYNHGFGNGYGDYFGGGYGDGKSYGYSCVNHDGNGYGDGYGCNYIERVLNYIERALAFNN